MKLTVAIFLVGLTGCLSSLSSSRRMHRSLLSDACREADAALFANNPDLEIAHEESIYDLDVRLADCSFANGASGDCTVDAAGLDTTTALEEACQAAGGEQYIFDVTYSCSAASTTIDGLDEITLTGGIINNVFCYAAICTLADATSDAADYHELYIPGVIDQTVFTCTGETSVEFSGGAPQSNDQQSTPIAPSPTAPSPTSTTPIAPSPTASSPTSTSLTAPSPSVNAPTDGGPPPPSPMAPESSHASVPNIRLWSVFIMLVAGVMGVFVAL